MVAAVVAGVLAASGSAALTCTIYWTGATSGTWDGTTTSNWSLTDGGADAGRVPLSTDVVCMSTSPTNSAVTLTTTAHVDAINWPSASTSLDDQGTLAVSAASTIADLTLDAGVLAGPGQVTVSSSFGVTASGGYLGIQSSSGTGAALVDQVGGTLTGSLYFFEGSTFDNAGTGNTLSLSDASVVDDADGNSANKLTNESGDTVSHDGTGTPSLEVRFDNKSGGTLASRGGGTLFLNDFNTGASSSNEGTLSVDAGSNLEVDSENLSFATGATETGAGTFVLNSPATVNGTTTLANVDVAGGGTLKAASAATSTVSGLTFDGGVLTGPGQVTVSSSFAVTARSGYLGIQGTTGTGAVLVDQAGGTLTGSLYFYEGSTFDNAGTGTTLSLSDATQVIDADGNSANKLTNENGDTVSYDGSGTPTLGVRFDNKSGGTISSQGGGTLFLSDGNTGASSTNEGALSVGATSNLEVDSENLSFATGASETGAGTFKVNNPATTLNGTTTLANVDVAGGGTLKAASGATSTISGLTLDGGVLTGPGRVTVSSSFAVTAHNGYLGIQGTSGTGAVLVDQAGGTLTGSLYFYEGSTFDNAGTGNTLSLSDVTQVVDADGSSANKLTNESGDTVSYDGTATPSLEVRFDNKSGGTISSQGGGTLFLNDFNTGASSTNEGTLSVDAGSNLEVDSENLSFATGATETGAGTFKVNDPATTLNGNTTLANVDVAGSGTLKAASAATSTISGLTLDGGVLAGPGQVTVSSSFDVTDRSGYLGIQSFSGTGAVLVDQAGGTLTGPLYFYEGSTFDNTGTGNTLSLSDATVISDADGNSANKLTNESSDAVSYDGTATPTLGVRFDNRSGATISSQGGGTLLLSDFNTGASSSNEGNLLVGAGSNMEIDSENLSFATGATETGAGTFKVNNPATTLNGNTTLANVDVAGTLKAASAAASVISGLTFDGGTLAGPGSVTIPSGGSLSMTASGGSLGISGTTGTGADLINQADVNLAAGAAGTLFFYEASKLENQATIAAGDGTQFYNTDLTTNQVLNDVGATLSYAGSSAAASATIPMSATNNGTITVTQGTLNLPNLTNLNTATSTLTGGTYTATGGTIALAGNVQTNSATVNLGASPSEFTNASNSSSNALVPLSSNTADGSLDLQQSLSVAGALSNAGTITVEKGTLRAPSAYTQTAGTTTVVGGASCGGGTLESGTGSSAVTINGGTLAGTGCVKGNIAGAGTVMPSGTVSGPMNVTGTYDNSLDALSIPITGTTTAGTQYGQMVVSGAVTLGGTLALSTSLCPTTLGSSSAITIIQAASVTGDFSTITGATLSGCQWVVSKTATTVVLTPQPLPPALTSISPTSGPTIGGTPVTITGTHFTGATAVKFGSTNATNFKVNSDTQITATSPAAASAGTVDITVTTGGGTSSTVAADQFTYAAVPTVTAVSPSTGSTAGGTHVTITGTNFVAGATVKFGTNSATGVTVSGPTSITATSPAGSAGTVDVTVTTTSGASALSSADQFTYVSPPAVTGVSPGAGPTAGSTSVTITGTNLGSATAVDFGTTQATITNDTATSITATSPAGSAGTVDVTVTTPGGTSATSNADKFSYDPKPTVSGVSPNAGPTAGGNSVTITGTGFVSGATVKFGTASATGVTFNTATSITATAPAGSAGTVDVTVTTPGGTSTTSSADHYTYESAPTVSGVNPTAGPTAGGTPVTITGTNLTGATTVKFGTASATNVVSVSSTQVTATAPAGSAGAVDVTVTTPAGTSATSNADKYTYEAAPTVTGIAPSAGPTAGGTPVTITGTNFDPGSTVAFGGVAATGVTVVSSTSITATSPAGSAGTVDVTVTTPGGTSATSNADKFSYDSTPSVSALSPKAGPQAGGTPVTITGTGFVSGATVKFGSNEATGVTVNGSTSISATSPAGTGTVDVTVTTPGGTSATSGADQFTYAPAPTVTGVTPSAGSTGGATSVTITGTSLASATAVNFGATPATITNDTSTSITATSPAHTAGTVDVTVVTPGGTSATSANDHYTYTAPVAPIVTGVHPSSGPIGGGTVVTIAGTSFTGATGVSAVKFGSSNAASYTVNSDTQITATSPAGSAGTVDITVTASGGTSATGSPDRFTYITPPPANYALSISFTGAGSGSVNGSGVSCPGPGPCSASYASGSIIKLTATPASGSTFGGWGGACTGTQTCTVTMTMDRAVTANFTKIPPAPSCSLRADSAKVLLKKPKKGKRKTQPGTLQFTAKCDQAVSATLTGTLLVTEGTKKKKKHKNVTFKVGPVRANIKPNTATTITVKLPGAALGALKKHDSMSGSFTLTATNANGKGTAQTTLKGIRPA
jgi:hypothetical protein